MPEGDTIHRAAAALRAALGEGPVASFEAPGARGRPPATGEPVAGVEARGKHLLVRFGGGTTLHTHLGMHGSWRVDAGGATPAALGGRPGTAARIATPRAVATCRRAATVELLDRDALRRHPVLGGLGPDLCLPDPDLDEVARRLDALLDPATPIGVALLDQRPACGIGNVYRSEVLWACRVDPAAPLSDVDDATRRELYATAGRLLRANLRGGPRRTLDGGLAVYDRAGRPCPRCGTPIASRRLGEQARTTWWCPACQTPGR
jgi:endonuclease-8